MKGRTLVVLVIMVTIFLVTPALATGRIIERPREKMESFRVDMPFIFSNQFQEDKPWWETTERDADRNRIDDVVEERASQDGVVDVFLSFSRTPVNADVAWLEAGGFDVVKIYPNIDAIGIRKVPSGDLETLLQRDGAVFIDPTGQPVMYSHIATPAAKARESDEYSPETAWELGYQGRGVNIAIMDTGVDNQHPSIVGKWVGGADISKPETFLWPRDGSFDADDTNGHGTTCTGISMGTGAPDGQYMGAAPEAMLVDIRIGTVIGYAPGEGPIGFYDATLEGAIWAKSHKDDEWAGQSEENQGIDIISVSWGIDVGGSTDGSDPYSRSMDDLAEAGVIPVIAAGNSGPDNDGFAGLGAASLAITIAATDDMDTVNRSDDEIATYSSRGPRKDNGDDDPSNELKPDVSTPGTRITQAQFDRFGDGSGNGYGNRGSGTSYATPLVAGVVALMLEANGNLTPRLAKEILRFTAERMGNATLPEVDPFWNKDHGWGMVDAYKAVVVAGSIENVDEIDPELQAFIWDIDTNGSSVTVDGIAWARVGRVESVEVRFDGSDWREAKDLANETWAQWTTKVDKSKLGKGDHTVEVRAVAGGKYSLTHNMTFYVDKAAEKPVDMGAAPLYAIGIIIAIVVLYIIFKKFPGLKKMSASVNGLTKKTTEKPKKVEA
jgi:subtilisin family serine protease